MKGKKYTEEEKQSETFINKYKKISIANTGKKASEETRLKQSIKAKLRERKPCAEETKKKIGAKNKIAMKKNWQDPEYREKTIERTLKGLIKRPTSLEKQMIDIIQRNNLPYKYTGDGSFIIGFKNPDFININGEKVCIEVGNIFHHQPPYEEERKVHFAKYGWKCIVFMTNKLNEQEILDTLRGEGLL